LPIKRFEISSIDARRFTKHGEKQKNIRIDQNSKVTMVSELNDKEAYIEYRWTANYSGLGLIKIEGSLVFEGDAPKLVQQYSANNNMPNEIANEIHTTIMNNCIPTAVLLARDIRLPPPIPMPKVNIHGGQKKKGGDPRGYA
jgi:hypothetical protein